MAEPERKTARSVLAYERGAQIAQRLTVISVLIGLAAIILGGAVVWWAKRDLDQTNERKIEALEELRLAQVAEAEAKQSVAKLTAVNERLIRLGGLVSGLRPDDTTGTSLALQEIDALLLEAETSEAVASVATRLREMRIGIYTTTNALDKAIEEQRALNAALGPNTGRVLDLAILQCRAKDLAGARETLRAGLTSDDATLLTEDDRFLSACGNTLSNIASELKPPAPQEPSPTGDNEKDVEPRASESGETPLDMPVSCGGPETANICSGTDPGASSNTSTNEITKVFLHIRTEGQRASAVAIGEAICKAGFAMPGVQAVTEPSVYPKSARVIYYHSDQSDAAVAIARKVENLATSLGLSGFDIELDARLYRAEGLPRDRVEIWFAADAPASGGAVEKDFNCPPGGR